MKKTLLAAAITLAAAPAFAEIDPIVIEYNSSRLGLTDQTSGRSVTVINSEELSGKGYASVQDALKTVPGISFSDTGTPTQNTFVRIRGANQKSVLVLIDGVPALDGTNGYADLSLLSTASVSRIEVIRGNSVAQFGNKAVGGVVFIETKPTDSTNFISGAVGRFGTTQLSLGTSTETKSGFIATRINKSRSSGYSTSVTANADKDGYEDESGQLILSGSNEVADYVFQATKEQGQVEHDGYLSTKEYSNYRYGAEFSLFNSLGSLNTKFNSGRFESGFGGGVNYVNRVTGIELSQSLPILNSTLIGVKRDVTDNSGSSWAGITREETIDSVFAETLKKVNGYSTSIALRSLDSDRMSDLAWSVSAIRSEGAVRPFINLSQAATPPTAFDEGGYDANGNGIVDAGDILPAPNLKPEESTDVELGVSLFADNFETRVALFGAQVKDKLNRSYSSTSTTNIVTNDIGSSDRYGFEASTNWTYNNLSHTATVSRSVSENASGVRELAYPEYNAAYTVELDSAVGKFSTEFEYESGRTVSGSSSKDRLITNLTYARLFTERVSINVRLDNAFDENWSIPSNSAGKPRTWTLAAKYSF